MTWEKHQDKIITKANRQLGMIRQTCHFVKNIAQKRSLYIAIVRSLFEHCGEIWGPNVVTTIDKFEPIQKIAVKWILAIFLVLIILGTRVIGQSIKILQACSSFPFTNLAI